MTEGQGQQALPFFSPAPFESLKAINPRRRAVPRITLSAISNGTSVQRFRQGPQFSGKSLFPPFRHFPLPGLYHCGTYGPVWPVLMTLAVKP